MALSAWDLSSLYSSMSDPDIISDLKKLEVMVNDLEKDVTQWLTQKEGQTGSTFCESVFGDFLEKNTSDEDLLSYYDFMLGGQVGTIVDCLSAFYFEKSLFNKRVKGPLTVAEMQEATLMGFRETYGDAVAVDSYNKNMWVSRLHFYNPAVNYYNFPYTFGMLFSLALYSKFQEQGSKFIPKYDNFLKMTGSANVKQLGELVEIDVNDSNVWGKSIQIILDKIDNFKKLI
jgi:oligoendopeptidase F